MPEERNGGGFAGWKMRRGKGRTNEREKKEILENNLGGKRRKE